MDAPNRSLKGQAVLKLFALLAQAKWITQQVHQLLLCAAMQKFAGASTAALACYQLLHVLNIRHVPVPCMHRSYDAASLLVHWPLLVRVCLHLQEFAITCKSLSCTRLPSGSLARVCSQHADAACCRG